MLFRSLIVRPYVLRSTVSYPSTLETDCTTQPFYLGTSHLSTSGKVKYAAIDVPDQSLEDHRAQLLCMGSGRIVSAPNAGESSIFEESVLA